jgi:hypothetical protein
MAKQATERYFKFGKKYKMDKFKYYDWNSMKTREGIATNIKENGCFEKVVNDKIIGLVCSFFDESRYHLYNLIWANMFPVRSLYEIARLVTEEKADRNFANSFIKETKQMNPT